MDFFCSKDCPDLCGVKIDYKDGRYTFQGKPEIWSDPGFVCAKFNIYAQREINNGLCSWQLIDGNRKKMPDREKAIEALADFLTHFRNKKILYLRGSGSLAYNMACWDLLFSKFSNCWTVSGGVCDNTGCCADQMDFGVLHNPAITNLEQADTIILYGKNAHATSQHLYVYLKRLKKKGKVIIYVDPVQTETARLADRYIMLRPGCDGLLACALLTAAGLEDGHDIDRLLTRSGVSHEDFVYMLDRVQNGRTAHIKGVSIQRHSNGANSYRWINRLAVKTGSMDLLYFGHGSKRFWKSPEVSFADHLPVEQIPGALAKGEFDLYVNIAANPAMTYPDANLWAQGLSRTSTLVVDTNHSRTTEQADFFLKVGGMFSQADFMASYFFNHEGTRNRLTTELSDLEAAQMLAGKLGIEFTFGKQEQLRVKPERRGQYSNSSLSLAMPPTSRKLQLLTASHRSYLNSQILPGMEKGLQVIHINPDDAKGLGVESGDTVRVTGPGGNFNADALITEMIAPGVVMCWKNIPMVEGVCNCAIHNKTTDAGSGLDYYSWFVTIERVS
ncbi:MAG: molybdopterin dinucleotide binding domain-containing protein [Desulfobacteraceae bacterium]|jgi:formylmethanofuran dehydrogenase subunit B/formylmethanofuran dehydrogenase subunit D